MRHSPVAYHFTQYIKDGVVLTRYTNGQLKKKHQLDTMVFFPYRL